MEIRRPIVAALESDAGKAHDGDRAFRVARGDLLVEPLRLVDEAVGQRPLGLD